MNNNLHENNPHYLYDEYSNQIGVGDNALTTEVEQTNSQEFNENNKNQSQSSETKQNKKQSNDTSSLVKLLAKITPAAVSVTVATGAIVIAPIVATPSASITLKSEYVSFNKYECVFETAKSLPSPLNVTVKNDKGEQFTLTPTNTDTAYSISADNLTPETDYDIQVLDGEGKSIYSDSFTTDPFITLTKIDETKYNFSLHNDINYSNDFVFNFFSADGKDFNSNLIYDDLSNPSTCFLYVDGLYNENYNINLELYFPNAEEPIVYTKTINLGTLTPLDFTAEYQTIGGALGTPANQIFMAYNWGDIEPYTIIDVTLTPKMAGRVYTLDDLTIDSQQNITAVVASDIPEGEYDISIYAEIAGKDYGYNQIWLGTITVPPSTTP